MLNSLESTRKTKERIVLDNHDSAKVIKFGKFDPYFLIIINDFQGLKQFLHFEAKYLDNQTIYSLLYLAYKFSSHEIVRLLLEYGACPPYLIKHEQCLTKYINTEETAKIIDKYKTDKGFKFLFDNRNSFRDVKLIFDDSKKLVGKRCSLEESFNSKWELSWHGTLMQYVPSIIKNGFKKCGDKIGKQEIDIRTDLDRIEKVGRFVEKGEWAKAVFTSKSIFYAGTRAYAEHFRDNQNEEWILVLECRLKPGSYKMRPHTFNQYTLRLNEDKNVEVRSENSADVKLAAVWLLNTNFIRNHTDHSILLDFLKRYIPL